MAEGADGDLSVTALYTSAVWHDAGFPGAALLMTREAGAVRSVTDLVVGMVRLVRRLGGERLPSLRGSLVQRHTTIDGLVREAVDGGVRQVLELAAGLSPRGVALSEDGGVRYVELDLPPMVARKEALLARTEAGRAVLQRPGLVRVGADAREVDLGALLGPGPAVVVAEGLVVYLDGEARAALWRRIAEALRGRPGSSFVFDWVPPAEEPAPGWLGRGLGWLMGRFTGGRGFVRDGRTRAAIESELRACGFGGVEAVTPGEGVVVWSLRA